MVYKFFAGLVLACVVLGGRPVCAEQPNILMIYLDDFGWKDTGYMGSDFYETPHLDALASGGMVFRSAYSSAANCAPARACLLSGQYTPRHQIFNVGTGPRGKSAYRRLVYVPGKDVLDPQIKTWAQQLQSVGYKTATIGKWHLSDDPIPYGFDWNVGGTHSGGPPNGYYPPHKNVPNLTTAPDGEYLTDRLSEEACKFIDANQDRPWMLYLTHFAVHTPLNAKRELLQKYQTKPAGELHHDIRMATMIQAVDDGVGKILATLEERGIRDKTVILFYSDNGGYGPATDMDPLKGYKGTYYEGGIRVPFFVNWPGVVAPNTESAEPITGVDIYPTLCEIAGAPLPDDQPADGRSLVGLFKGELENLDDPQGPRSLYWHFPAYLSSYAGVWDEQQDPLFRSRPCSVVRQGKWKLMQFFETNTTELYDLESDIGETRDLAGSHPEVAERMLKKLRAWQSEVNAPIPSTINPDFDADLERAAIEATTASQGRSRKRGNRQRPPKQIN